jgi:hypothetical protein
VYLPVLVALFPAAPTAAQDAPADTVVVTLVGEVRDAVTDAPLADASVTIPALGRSVATDRNGFFRFDSIPAGTWTFRTEHLGYAPNDEPSTIGPGQRLLVRLQPRPIELGGLYATIYSRLRDRRGRAPGRVIAWDREELAEAIQPDVGRFVQTRGMVQWARCGGEWEGDLPNCVMRRGSARRLEVWVDEAPLLGALGTSTLWARDPRDLWAVEFLPDCGELRIYTKRFMEAVREGRTRLRPMVCEPG